MQCHNNMKYALFFLGLYSVYLAFENPDGGGYRSSGTNTGFVYKIIIGVMITLIGIYWIINGDNENEK